MKLMPNANKEQCMISRKEKPEINYVLRFRERAYPPLTRLRTEGVRSKFIFAVDMIGLTIELTASSKDGIPSHFVVALQLHTHTHTYTYAIKIDRPLKCFCFNSINVSQFQSILCIGLQLNQNENQVNLVNVSNVC